MTKTELTEIVDRIYATWNQQIPQLKQKDVYDAWWRILQQLPADETHATIDAIAKQDGYMPRPGTIYRHTLQRINGWDPPTELEAWQQLRHIADNAYNGNYTEEQPHPLVKQAIKRLGGPNAFRLHTNGDREQFIETYRQIVRDAEARLTYPAE